MQLKNDGDKFDELQSIFIGGIIDEIKVQLEEAKLPNDKVKELLENISFSVASILDASRSVEYEGVEASPVVTFQDGEKDLVYPGGNSWMHEYVFGTISEIYGE
jgi:hypothetical protein